MLGIALVDKPVGLSSHDAIYRVRRALGIRKIGHAGTLDPNATGLLVMAVGEATRFLQYLDLEPKVYEGVAKLGVSTASQDVDGEVTRTQSTAGVTLDQLTEAAKNFLGEIDQIPPMYSAVQLGGQRLYKLARKGETVDRPPRRVKVHELELVSLDGDLLSFRVVCSGGTYVRTLANDLGDLVGVGAHLVTLRRTTIGAFHVADAVPPESVADTTIIPLEVALKPMPLLRLTFAAAERAKHGGEFALETEMKEGKVALIDDDGVYAVAMPVSEGVWRPARVMPKK